MSRGRAAQPIRTTIFVVGDEEIPRVALVHLLESRPEYEIVSNTTVELAANRPWLSPPSVALIHVIHTDDRVLRLIGNLHASGISVVVLFRKNSARMVHACRTAGATGFVAVEGNSPDLFHAINAAAIGEVFISPILAETVLGIPFDVEKPSRELSAREQQVLMYLAYGYSNAQIARQLRLSAKSIETYRARLMEKLQLKDRTDLVKYALVTGVLSSVGLEKDVAS